MIDACIREGNMAVNFGTFRFNNTTGIPVAVVLEAPIGTQVLDFVVPPNSDVTRNPNVTDAPSARVSAADGSHTTTQNVSASGTPYPPYIETLDVDYSVGNIHGRMKTMF
jgi:hypothetical protein